MASMKLKDDDSTTMHARTALIDSMVTSGLELPSYVDSPIQYRTVL